MSHARQDYQEGHQGLDRRGRGRTAAMTLTAAFLVAGAAAAQTPALPPPPPGAPPATPSLPSPDAAPALSSGEAPAAAPSAAAPPAVPGGPAATPSVASEQQPVFYFASPPLPAAQASAAPHVDLHAELRNLFLFRNDTDFDRTAPFYDANGQTVGAFATVFRPMLTLHADQHVRLYYEAELGLNYWSKNNPDEENPQADDIFVLKHRQVYAEGEVAGGKVGFRAGYQLFEDPTGLFLGHWIGAAHTWYSWDGTQRAGVFVGQIPDQTYEGIIASENNFKHDITVFGPRADLSLGQGASASAAVVTLYDSHLVDRTRWVVAPALRLSYQSGKFSGFADGVLQMGKAEQAALGNANQNIFAWATQLHGSFDMRPAALDLNLLVLSSDDAKDGNKNDGTFLYSSRSRSATIILTEDEHRNWYDQLDRTMGSYRGGFWEHRAGLVVGDAKATWHASEVFRPALVVGAGAVLQKNNALNHRFVGVETDLNLQFVASEHLSLNVVGGAMVPGAAAAALVNRIDRSATAPIYMAGANLLATY